MATTLAALITALTLAWTAPLPAQGHWRVATRGGAPPAGRGLMGATLAAADSSLRITYACRARHGVPEFAFGAVAPFRAGDFDSALAADYTDIYVRFDSDRPVIVRGVIAPSDRAYISLAPEAISGFSTSTALVRRLLKAGAVRVEWSTADTTRTARFDLPPNTRIVLNRVRRTCGRSAL